MSQPENIRPVEILRNVKSQFPQLSKMVEVAYSTREQVTAEQWPDWCFLPRPAWYYAIKSFYGEDYFNTREGRHNATISHFACCWRYGQGIYTFDPELLSALADSDSPGKIPAEVLFRLPEWCIYIPTPGLRFYENQELYGFFAMLDSSGLNTNDPDTPCLLIEADAAADIMPIPIPLINCTIQEGLEKTLAVYDKQTPGMNGIDVSMLNKSMLIKCVTPLISLLLYLCSDAPEIDNLRKPGTSPLRIQPKKVKGGLKLFPAAGPTTWYVGQYIGETLRKAGYSAPGAAPAAGHHKRPHLRRGHWHGYWTGPRTETQKLIVKWLPPRIVGTGTDADEQPDE